MKKFTPILGLGAVVMLAACQTTAPTTTATTATSTTTAPATTATATTTSAAPTTETATTTAAAPTSAPASAEPSAGASGDGAAPGTAGRNPAGAPSRGPAPTSSPCTQEQLGLARAASDQVGPDAASAQVLTITNKGTNECALPSKAVIVLAGGPHAFVQLSAPAAFDGFNQGLALPAGKAAKTTIQIADAEKLDGCEKGTAYTLALQVGEKWATAEPGELNVPGCTGEAAPLLTATPFELA